MRTRTNWKEELDTFAKKVCKENPQATDPEDLMRDIIYDIGMYRRYGNNAMALQELSRWEEQEAEQIILNRVRKSFGNGPAITQVLKIWKGQERAVHNEVIEWPYFTYEYVNIPGYYYYPLSWQIDDGIEDPSCFSELCEDGIYHWSFGLHTSFEGKHICKKWGPYTVQVDNEDNAIYLDGLELAFRRFTEKIREKVIANRNKEANNDYSF